MSSVLGMPFPGLLDYIKEPNAILVCGADTQEGGEGRRDKSGSIRSYIVYSRVIKRVMGG